VVLGVVVSSDMDYTPVSFKEAYLPLIRGAELAVIRSSRHACTADQPEQVNQVLTGFFSRAA
jgi:pimeloyl-ACP methyl ester carboxylesterase